MAATSIDVGSELQSAIQAAVQPKLMENGWVVDETDTTLSEYVTMMLVNGKDQQGVQSELGGDLLGVGDDDPAVTEFARWLFEQLHQLQASQRAASAESAQQHQQPQPIPTVQDSSMEDSTSSGDAPPTGPRSMRNGSLRAGRGGRMLGQLNRNMERSNDLPLPENLRRIRGAAGGQAGRINSHAARDGTPRGPRNGIANGVSRIMNGGRGGHIPPNMNPINPMMNGSAMGGNDPQQQMQFMQLMEMQANMMAQFVHQQNSVQMVAGNGLSRGGRGGSRGGRGGPHQSRQVHAVDGKLPDGALTRNTGASGMDIDGEESSDKFSTMCHFNFRCTNPACPFAHQSPAAPPNTSVDMADTCSHGAACTNHKCSGRHPSPAQRTQHAKTEVDCKFFPNCENLNCPFRHPAEKPCRNGADCTTPDCKFSHSKIMCRYNPCLNPVCAFKHAAGQKRGKFEDKVWTPNGGSGKAGDGGKVDRFAEFTKQEEEEELILPGEDYGNGEIQQDDSQMETQIVV